MYRLVSPIWGKEESNKGPRCIIITAYVEGSIKRNLEIKKDDFIICADGGYLFAKKEGIKANLLIGDFDSLNYDISLDEGELEVLRLPVEKDDTDTHYSLKYGIEKGFNEFIIVGGLGGRIDHTLANFQSMSYACDMGKKISLIDDNHYVTMIKNSSIKLRGEIGTNFSVFSFSDKCRGLSIEGGKYNIEDVEVTNTYPLGVSNQMERDWAKISCTEGKLLIMLIEEE